MKSATSTRTLRVSPVPERFTVFGDRVRWARQLRGLLAREVVDATSASAATYSRIENSDTSEIDLEVAHSLALALGTPLAWLSTPPRAFATSSGTQFRANSRMTKTAQGVVTTWLMLYAELLATLDEFVTLPPTTFPFQTILDVRPQQAATEVREALGLPPDQPITNLVRSLEKLGVYVGVVDFDDEVHLRNHDASSAWFNLQTGRALPIILSRKHSSWERTRFSVAHEAGHLALHRQSSGSNREQEATEFAAELLLPSNTLRKEWPHHVTVMGLLELKQRWGMSIAALIQHGYRNRLLGDDRRVSLFKQLSNGRDPRTGERWRVREPGASSRVVERPLLVANAIEVGFGVRPDLGALFRALPPSPRHEWYEDFIPNFATAWSRDLNAQIQTQAVAQSANVVPLRR